MDPLHLDSFISSQTSITGIEIQAPYFSPEFYSHFHICILRYGLTYQGQQASVIIQADTLCQDIVVAPD